MILFPQNALSLISLVLFFLFLQSGIFFLYFYLRAGRPLGVTSREHFFFAMMSFGQALYSFGACQLYSAPNHMVGLWWQRFQWFAAILLFVFFIHFSIHYLRIHYRFLFWSVDLPAIFFAPAALFWPGFLSTVPSVKTFQILKYVYRIYELELGWMAQVVGAWIGIHLMIMLFNWFSSLMRKKTPSPALAAVGLFFFALTAVNEILVQFGFYRSPYLLEYGFLFFSVAFYFQFILDFFRLYRTNVRRSEELTRLNEESRFFINTVAHDLKAPLMSIEGFATLLKEERLADFSSEQSRDYLSRISKNANHMMQRLTELKNFINIGIIHEEIEPIDLEELMAEILKSFELSLKPFKVEVSILPSLKSVYFSRRRLQDILMNLIDNAVKYCQNMEKPSLKIRVTQPRPKEICFMIEDNGPGIDPVHHERIFDLFYRVDSDPTGTGIGLAAAKKIITQAGGKIWVESDIGRGSRFLFTLPALQ
jgi:signal transduction histidine kinase